MLICRHLHCQYRLLRGCSLSLSEYLLFWHSLQPLLEAACLPASQPLAIYCIQILKNPGWKQIPICKLAQLTRAWKSMQKNKWLCDHYIRFCDDVYENTLFHSSSLVIHIWRAKKTPKVNLCAAELFVSIFHSFEAGIANAISKWQKMTKNMFIYETMTYGKLNYLMNWALFTSHFIIFSGILFGLIVYIYIRV